MLTRLIITRLLLLGSTMLLGLGLVGPCMTLVPKFGKYDALVRLLETSYSQPRTYSVLGGIMQLFRDQNTGIAIVLLAFSVIFPVFKLLVMAYTHVAIFERAGKSFWMRLAHNGGKWSMLDVFVIAILVVAVKGLPGGSTIVLGWGLWCFASSVLLSIVAAMVIGSMERRLERPMVPVQIVA